MNILAIIQKCNESKICDKLFNLLVFYFYRAHDGQTLSLNFIALIQFDVLSNLFRQIGEEYFKNSVDLQFWSHNQLQFVKIILAFQIISIAYILCSSQIQRKKIQNEKKLEEKLQQNQFINIISHMNKFTQPENIAPDLEYIGGFTRIIQKDSLSEHKDKFQSQNSKKSLFQEKGENNIWNFFIQILQSMIQNLIIFIEKSNENFDEMNLKDTDIIAHEQNNQIQYIPKDFNCHLQQDISPIHQEEDQQFSDFKQQNGNSDQSSIGNLYNYIKDLKTKEGNKGIETYQFINQKTRTFIKSRCVNENSRFYVIHFQIYKKEMKKKENKKNKNIIISAQTGFSEISICPQTEVKVLNQVSDSQTQQEIANNNFRFSFNSKFQNTIQENIKEESSKQSGQQESSEAIEQEKQNTDQKLFIKQRTQSHSNFQQQIQFQQLNKDVLFVSHHRQSLDIQKQSIGLQRSFSFGSKDFNDIQLKKSENAKDNKSQDINQIKIEVEIDQKKEPKEKDNNKKNAKKKLFKKLNKIEDQFDIHSVLHDSQIDRDIKRSQYIENDENQKAKKDKVYDKTEGDKKKIKVIRKKSEQVKNNQDRQQNMADQIQSIIQPDDYSILVSQYNGNSIQSNQSGFDISSRQFDKNQLSMIKKAKSQFDFQHMIKYQDEKKIDQLQKLCQNLPKGKHYKQVKDELEQVKVSFKINDKQKNDKKNIIIPNLNNQDSLESSLLPSSAFKDSVLSMSISNFKKKSSRKLKIQSKLKKGTKSDTLKKLIDHYENKIEQKQTALEFFKKKAKDLQTSLESNKVFLNMAVHDMRNPTNQMEFLVSQTVIQLKELRIKLQEKCEQLNHLLNQQSHSISLNFNQRQSIQQQILDPDQIQSCNKNQQFNSHTYKQLIEKPSFQDLNINKIQQRKSIQIFRQNDEFNIQVKSNQKQNQNRFSLQDNKINEQFKKIQKKQIQLKKAYIQKDENNLCFKIKKQSKSIDYKKKKSLFEILKRKFKSQQQNKNDNKHKSDLKFQLFNQVELYKNEVIEDQTYVVQSIKNKIDFINNQKNQFYNKFNYLDKKQFSNSMVQEKLSESDKSDTKKEVFIQAIDFVKKIKDNIFNLKSINEINESEQSLNPSQEPKIMKKKVKNLHLSFDPSLLKQNINQKQNHLTVESRENDIQIHIQQIQNEENQIDSRQINQQSQIQIIVNFMQEFNEDLNTTIGNLENCKFCSVMLLNLINDMMDLAKSEKMKFELNCEFFDLTSTIKRAFDTLSYFGQQKNIMPKLIVDSKIEQFFQNLKGDEGRFSQILLNFLSNAFKFSSQNGSITLELCQADDQIFCQKKVNNIQLLMKNNNQMLKSDNNQNISPSQQKYLQEQQVIGSQIMSENQDQKFSENEEDDGYEEYYISFQMRIRDSGMGISRENIGKLFLNFGKLADPSGCNKTGTGLGLSICKHLIEKMGGKVKVESEGIGKGTTFIIKMQAISKVQDSIYSDNQNQLNLSHIHPRLSSLPNKEISEILKEQNEALQKAQNQSQEGKLSGILDRLCVSAQKALHKDFMNSNLSIRNVQIIEECKKEIKLKSPLKKLSGLKDQNAQSSIADAIKQLKVLIINDEFFILQMLKMMVKKVNIEDIDTAQNGFDGFNMVIQKQYDFIICDLNMPVMDGFECIEKIKDHYDNKNQFFKQKQELNFCPFLIACSAFITVDIEAKAYESGFELVVESPLTISILTDRIIVKSLEKKALIKKQYQIALMNDKQESIQQSQSSQEIENNEQKNKIQILIEKLDNKLRIKQQQNLQRKNSGHLHASLNDIDIMSDDEESSQSIQSSQQIDYQESQAKNRIIKQSLGKISEVDEISANKLVEKEDHDDQQILNYAFYQDISGESKGNIPQLFDNQRISSQNNIQESQLMMHPNQINFEQAVASHQNFRNNIFSKNQESQNITFQNISITSMASQGNNVQTPLFNLKNQIKRMNSKQLNSSGLRKSENSSNSDSAEQNNQDDQI